MEFLILLIVLVVVRFVWKLGHSALSNPISFIFVLLGLGFFFDDDCDL